MRSSRRLGRSMSAIMPVSVVIRPERKFARADCATRGTGLIPALVERDDVAARDRPGARLRFSVICTNDRDVQRRRAGEALTEAAAQINDWDDRAAQV